MQTFFWSLQISITIIRNTTQHSRCGNDLNLTFYFSFSNNFPKILEITKTSIKLNHFKIDIRKLQGHNIHTQGAEVTGQLRVYDK